MQSKLLRIGSIVIFFLAIVFFIFAGTLDDFSSIFSSDKELSAEEKASFNDVVIKDSDENYRNAMGNLLLLNELNGFGRLPEDYLSGYALDKTILALAADGNIEKSGYFVTDDLVTEVMAPLFYDADGNYSKDAFDAFPAEDRRIIFNELKAALPRYQYYKDILGDSQSAIEYAIYTVNPSRTEGDFAIPAGENKTVHATYFTMVANLIAAYSSNSAQFGTKTSAAEKAFLSKFTTEKRSFDAVIFDKSTYPLVETKIYAIEHKDLFKKYNVAEFKCNSIEEANTAMEDFKKGERLSFFNSDSKSSKFKYALENKLENTSDIAKIVTLKKDEISDVIKTKTGYSIFRCFDAEEDAKFSKDEDYEPVTTYILSNEKELVENYWTSQAKAFSDAAKSSDFANTCKKFNVEKVEIPAFALVYGSSAITDPLPETLKGSETSEDFFKQVNSLKNIGEVSEPITTGLNVIVMSLTGIQNDTVTEDSLNKIESTLKAVDSTLAQYNILHGENVQYNSVEISLN